MFGKILLSQYYSKPDVLNFTSERLPNRCESDGDTTEAFCGMATVLRSSTKTVRVESMSEARKRSPLGQEWLAFRFPFVFLPSYFLTIFSWRL